MLRAIAASLLVRFAGHVLKWQEPVSGAADTIYRLLRFCRRSQKPISSFGNLLLRQANGSACNLHNYKSDNPPEPRVCIPQERFLFQRMRKPARAASSGAGGNSSEAHPRHEN